MKLYAVWQKNAPSGEGGSGKEGGSGGEGGGTPSQPDSGDTGLSSLLDKALGSPGLVWKTDSENPWSVYQSEVGNSTIAPFEGAEAVKSPSFGNVNGESWLETTITGPATVSFYYAMHFYNAKFFVTLDGETMFSREGVMAGVNGNGDTDWAQAAIEVGDGPHAIRFTYKRVPNLTNGPGYCENDGIRLDSVTVTPK